MAAVMVTLDAANAATTITQVATTIASHHIAVSASLIVVSGYFTPQLLVINLSEG